MDLERNMSTHRSRSPAGARGLGYLGEMLAGGWNDRRGRPGITMVMIAMTVLMVSGCTGYADGELAVGEAEEGEHALTDENLFSDEQSAEKEGEDRRAVDSELVGMNEPARDGKFQFTVSSLECGIATIGDGFLSSEAQGQFCLLGVTVENIGDKAQLFTASNQVLLDEQGREFSADGGVTLIHNDEGDGWLTEINPGNGVRAEIVFDVPRNVTLVQARLHDSMFSDGVVVHLE